MSPEPAMRAALLETFGAPFRIATIARPSPGPGEALVRVVASGVNPLDLKIHAGEAAHARVRLPAILGLDLAGVVAAVGSGVTRFRPGDEVYGMAGGIGGLQGTLAEYIAVDADVLAIKPANLSMREAAAAPLVIITAWEGLVDRAHVQAGQNVFVIGGAGGVGQMAIQIALAFGAQVFASGSASSREAIERLGARFVDRATPIAEIVEPSTAGRGFDLVYDTAGALDDAFLAVRRFGHVVSSLGWSAHSLAPLSFRAATYSGVFTLLPLLTGEGRAHHGEILGEAKRLAEAGRLLPKIDPRRFTLETANDAYRAMSSGGKMVVDVARPAAA
jgi:NADPH:quinone reductase-like Zn-dependent oxidoreductase